MQKVGLELVQTIEWKSGMPVGAGDFVANLIHCVSDGDIVAHFATGDETRTFVTGDDFALNGVAITVNSGSFDIN
jgi:hypothetical protein